MLDDKEIEREHRKQLKEQKLSQAEVDNALRSLLHSPGGRKYLWWLLQIGRVGTQPFGLTESQTAFNCGELNVGNQILAHILTVDPEGYLRMQKERADAGRSDPLPDDGNSDTDDSAG